MGEGMLLPIILYHAPRIVLQVINYSCDIRTVPNHLLFVDWITTFIHRSRNIYYLQKKIRQHFTDFVGAYVYRFVNGHAYPSGNVKKQFVWKHVSFDGV